MTAVVTYDKLETNPFLNIIEVIDTRANIADPRDTSGNKRRKFVYDADPFHKSISFENMPYIVVKFPKSEEITSSVSGTKKGYMYTHQIIVRTARDGASNSAVDQGRTDMLGIVDDLKKTFNNLTVRETYHGWKMSKLKLTKLDSDTGSINQKQIYESIFELSYELPFIQVVA